ncbi:hypothetical protein [Lentzea aerocolonigenes]|uniref:hypothetical protein n=1 Tax=Lentzea aerocolonigenes TaxID=68170 RepID=UPI000AB43E98|nr:hypothetical protein [Lentzea aerocolonigenes]
MAPHLDRLAEDAGDAGHALPVPVRRHRENFLLPYVVLTDDRTFPFTAALHNLVITSRRLSIIPLITLFLGLRHRWRVDLLSGVAKS